MLQHTMSAYLTGACLIAAAVFSQPLWAASEVELAAIRAEIQQLKQGYEARIRALEARLQQTESAAKAAQSAATLANEKVSQVAATSQPAAASQPPGANAFNPAISLILSGSYTNLVQNPTTYRLPGFALGDAATPGSRGLGVNPSELHISANIDPDLYGAMALIVNPDNTAALEEAYFQTTGLGHGLTLKGGRFFSGIGAINQKHPHAWDFVDEPLANRVFLNYQYGDDGLQLRWIAPTETFIELGGEALRGSNFAAGGNKKNGIGAYSLFGHVGGDLGASQSWLAGLAYLQAKPVGRESGDIAAGADKFSGDSRLWTADFVWKWAPDGNAKINNAIIQGEYIRRKEAGLFSGNTSGITGDYSARQSGWYLQGLYQFMPRWRVGLRHDELSTQSLVDGSATLTGSDYSPSRNSVILEFAKSEFGRLRLQYNQDKSRSSTTDNQLFLQYQFTLGAHGAHQF